MGKELNKIRKSGTVLFIQGKERIVDFNFSVWMQIEEECGDLGSFEKNIEKEMTAKPFKTLAHFFYLACPDKSAFTDEEGTFFEEVTEKNVLSNYGLGDIEALTEIFYQEIGNSLPEDDGKKAGKEAKK